MNLIQLLLGFLAAILISLVAWRAKTLSRSGAVVAFVLGTVVFGMGGWQWSVILLGFFISSSGLSRFLKKRKQTLDEKFSKGSERDFGQVLANGGTAGLCVLAQLVFPGSSLPWVAFAASLAAVNADTWATELGVLSQVAPRLITTGKKVERGTSGGVSGWGSLAAFLGALFIAILAVLVWPGSAGQPSLVNQLIRLAVISLAGLLGSMVDSLLGATLQAIYHCPVCNKETERHPLHTCGSPTTLQRGLKWLNNDWVNTACALTGALAALLAGSLLPGVPGLVSASPATGGDSMQTFPLTVAAFENGQPIPVRFTCDADNLSPAIAWSDAPAGTKSFALIMDDPDAPLGTFTHWVLYNLPAGLSSLDEGLPATEDPGGGYAQGRNGFGRAGYGGPCPPRGQTHRYYFTLYALDLEPVLPRGLDAAGLQKAIAGHVLAKAQWMGTYSRK